YSATYRCCVFTQRQDRIARWVGHVYRSRERTRWEHYMDAEHWIHRRKPGGCRQYSVRVFQLRYSLSERCVFATRQLGGTAVRCWKPAELRSTKPQDSDYSTILVRNSERASR